MRAFFPGIKNA